MQLTGLVFAAPALALFATFVAYPLLRGLYLSFYRWAGYGDPLFVGLDNYRGLASDPIFRRAVIVTAVYTVASTVLQTLIPMAVAILLAQRWRGGVVFRTMIFIPAVVSLTVTGLLWQLALQPNGGFVNELLDSAGLSSWSMVWLGDRNTVVPVIIAVSLWQSLGFFMLIFYAGLQNIDPTLYESGRIDGAGPWRLIRFITIPMLKPVTAIVVTLNLINGLKVYDLIYALTNGGPANSSQSLGTYLYALAFGSINGASAAFGYANAIGVIIMISAAAVLLVLSVLRRTREA